MLKKGALMQTEHTKSSYQVNCECECKENRTMYSCIWVKEAFSVENIHTEMKGIIIKLAFVPQRKKKVFTECVLLIHLKNKQKTNKKHMPPQLLEELLPALQQP